LFKQPGCLLPIPLMKEQSSQAIEDFTFSLAITDLALDA
jgi:hypothetical protein